MENKITYILDGEHLEVTTTRGYKKAKACQKKEGSKASKCTKCHKPINTDDLYFAIGLRAVTAHERFYSKNGCIWYNYCPKCI